MTAAASRWIRCDSCGTSLKEKNLQGHLERVHSSDGAGRKSRGHRSGAAIGRRSRGVSEGAHLIEDEMRPLLALIGSEEGIREARILTGTFHVLEGEDSEIGSLKALEGDLEALEDNPRVAADSLQLAADAAYCLGARDLGASYLKRCEKLVRETGAPEDFVVDYTVRAVLIRVRGGVEGLGELEDGLRMAGDIQGREERDNALTSVACISADCAALTLEREPALLAVRAALEIEDEEVRDSVAGMVARKLALRNEEEPTSLELLQSGEELCSRVEDPMEVAFCHRQFAVAYARLGMQSEARRSLEASEGVLKKHSLHPLLADQLRAAVQCGFLDDAQRLRRRVNHMVRSEARGAERMLQEVGRDIHGPGDVLRHEDQAVELYLRCQKASQLLQSMVVAASVGFPELYADVERHLKSNRDPLTQFNVRGWLAEARTEGGDTAKGLENLGKALAVLRGMAEYGLVRVEELHRFVVACTMCYFHSREPEFLNLAKEALEDLADQGDGEAEGLEAIRLFALLVRDKRWRVTFFD
ncbi:MAG: hypothetical protein ACE5HJ_07480 [Thermoplasmata archaeon]